MEADSDQTMLATAGLVTAGGGLALRRSVVTRRAGGTPTLQAGGLYLAGFGLGLFAAAFLLFALEPLVSRLVLPRLGGSPAVWNTCVCFFQAALLIGYGYAHLSASRLRLSLQVALHAAVLLAAVAILPLSLGHEAPPTDGQPVGWLLWLLIRSVGLPFVAIAATAPLLQAWFSRTTHPQARDPYFLYAASNTGSLIALLAYPLVIEPLFGLSAQARYWTIGFMATAWLVVLCGLLAMRGAAPVIAPTIRRARAAAPPVTERLRWLVLSLVPSGLMLAVTTHITTDIASVPLFWVLPLALYILTFVVAFSSRAWVPERGLFWVHAVCIIAAAGVLFRAEIGTLPGLLIPLLAFTATALACHLELARRRPDPAHLTGYYMIMSAGGAVGGWLCALVAPLIFNTPLEYPLLLVAACLLRPAPPVQTAWAQRGDALLPFLVPVAFLAAAWTGGTAAPEWLHPVALPAMFAAPAVLLLWMAPRRIRFAIGVALCALTPALITPPVATARSFFGTFRVRVDPATQLALLQHGTTLHGVEGTSIGERTTPLSYYNHTTPFGRLIASLRQEGHPLQDVGLIGLGTGALSCYAHPGETWTFREIDPLAEKFARDTRWFHFLSDCPAHSSVILGDARVTLTADSQAKYDLLVVDAFSSDSIPMHLITREALALYFQHLKPGGLVAFHVTNRTLDLVPIVARLAADAGAEWVHLLTPAGQDALRQPRTEVMVVAPPGSSIQALRDSGWNTPAPGSVLWTDDQSDIVRVIRW